jgi:hypothetical protein
MGIVCIKDYSKYGLLMEDLIAAYQLVEGSDGYYQVSIKLEAIAEASWTNPIYHVLRVGNRCKITEISIPSPEIPDGTYELQELPQWIQDSLAVLNLLDFSREGKVIDPIEIPHIGRRVGESSFWVYKE